jgi:hypothetical protein
MNSKFLLVELFFVLTISHTSAIPDSMISDPADLRKIHRLDSARRAFLKKARIEYNSKIRKQYIDSVSNAYRNDYIAAYSRQIQKEFADSVRRQNYNRLEKYLPQKEN